MKFGSAVCLRSRLSMYQTGSPHRDYEIAYAIQVRDCRLTELIAKDQLAGLRVENTEWYRMHADDARNHLQRLAKQEREYDAT